MSTITVSTELCTITCPNCGGMYAISEVFRAEAYQLGKFSKMWYCPYCGSHRGYGESQHEKEVARLKAEAARLQNEKQMAEQQASMERMATERAVAERLKAERKLKRANAGVCTCCNRTFTNLARHMETKHHGKVFVPQKLTATEQAKAKGFKTT